MRFSEARNYGFNIILKEYAKFPKFLPLPCHFEHGWTALPEALASDLRVKKPLMLVFSKRRFADWKRKSKVSVEIMGSPFIHYKNLHNIKKKDGAKGTIAFPSHSTYDLKIHFDIERFCRALKKLPKEFHPITVCLFWIDYVDKADIYKKFGFQVVTAGPKFTNSTNFVKRYYDILSNHQYAVSNEIGSYTFYAVDFGLPFFIVGEAPLLENEGGRDANVAATSYLDDYRWGKKTMNLFRTGPIKKISPAQKLFVAKEMGTKDCLSSSELNKLLWQNYKKNFYWLWSFFPFVFDSIIAEVIFNGPWCKLIITLRKEMQRYFVQTSDQTKKTSIITKWIMHTRTKKIAYFTYHLLVNKLKSYGKLPNYRTLQKMFINKKGLEIGGPTRFFNKRGPLPIYSIARSIDNVNHALTTVWTGKIDDNGYWVNNKRLGWQYILDATDLSEIKDKKYDFIFSCNTLEHIANPIRAIKQWLNILKPKGLLIIIVPRKETNFDHKRKIITLEHLQFDYKNEIKEDDLSHMTEVFKFHDLELDPLAGTMSTFITRSRNNFENRCLHHHVFDLSIMKEIFNYLKLKTVETFVTHAEYVIIGRKKDQ